MPVNLLADIIGMIGTFLVVMAFFLIQLDKIDPKELAYNLYNLFGALCLLVSLCINFNLASFVIELFWITASLVGIIKVTKRKNLQRTNRN